MSLSRAQVEELVKTIKQHIDWALFALLGPQVITDDDLKALKDRGLLPTDVSASLIENAFILGILQGVLTRGEWLSLTYEQLLEEAVRTHTPIEMMAIQQVELTAAQHLKQLFTDIADGAFAKLSETQETIVTEATIQGIIKEKTRLALLSRQSYQQLAAELAHTLETDWRRDWRRVAETELQSAKVKGHAHAIANKVDIYSESDGPDSRVSVVPAPDACEDCRHHYLDSGGNPKIFKLSELMGAGSNADPDVSHKRGEGRHIHWKTTLPPLHPRCGCNLVFVPDGFHWSKGKLRSVHALDKGIGSPVVTPKGPPKPPSTPKVPSLPGMAAPDNTPGPGRPSEGGLKVQGGGGGSKIQYEYWSGPGQPPAEGGWEQTERGAWRRPLGSGGGPGQQEDPPQTPHAPLTTHVDPAVQRQTATTWGKSGKSIAETMDHMKHGDFGVVDPLNHTDDLGRKQNLNSTFKVAIAGNGNALWKPEEVHTEDVRAGVVPPGTQQYREVAAHSLDSTLELGLVPPTAHRSYAGATGSLQAWAEDAKPWVLAITPADTLYGGGLADVGGDTVSEGGARMSEIKRNWNVTAEMIKKNPELQEELSKLVVFDIVTNNTDRHLNNLMVTESDEGKPKIVAIDNGLAFGNGMNGYRSRIHAQMHAAGYHVKIPEKLATRLDNMTLGDFKRSLLEHNVEPWAATQSFLRAKYALHLQKTEGHLDFKHFVHSLHMVGGQNAADDNRAFIMQINDGKGTTDDRFRDFVYSWLDEAHGDSSHPHHEDAKLLMADIGSLFPLPEDIASQDFSITRESLKDNNQKVDSLLDKPQSPEPYFEPEDATVESSRPPNIGATPTPADLDATPVRRPQPKPAPKLDISDPFGSAGKPLHSPEG